jgi:C-terminal processing protease CtpA/Prc
MDIIKKAFYLLSLLSLLAIGFSCEDEDPFDVNTEVNDWILKNMNTYYFWNGQIPSRTNKNLRPAVYFESLLYKKEDRFSWIQEDYTDLLDLLSGIEMEAGYNFSLGLVSEILPDLVGSTSIDVFGVINYVKPHSPASNTGLKRGDLFCNVNGTRLTVDNYERLLNALSSPHTLGIFDSNLNPVKDIALSVTKYAENPVWLDTVYHIAGKKIGYLVYNFFSDDNGDDTYTYAKELNAIFGQLKATGIDELILDLRYNGGGALTTCAGLSSMISSRRGNEIFGLMQYNKFLDDYFVREEGSDYNKIYFIDDIGNIPVNKLSGLNRLYVITSNGTASASEFLINGLKVYMDVILIGDITYGKNVGSATIYEKDAEKQKTNKWGLQPIIVKLANSQNFSDYGNGFRPNVTASEYTGYPLSPLLPLGDTDETLLHTTLVEMGVIQVSTSLRADKKETFVPIYSSIDRTPVRKNVYIKPENYINPAF